MISLRGVGALGLAGLSWWLTATGCSKEAPPTTNVSSTSLVATGAGGASPCSGYFPDGFCAVHASAPESCECADCTTTAHCTKTCTDDGTCDFEAGEDCTCNDCFFTVAKCAPANGFCNNNDDGACATSENCLCKDCTDTAYCKTHCEDNGECVAYFEGCACADCKMQQECSGPASSSAMSSSSSSTSGAGGAGGSGAGGAGGA